MPVSIGPMSTKAVMSSLSPRDRPKITPNRKSTKSKKGSTIWTDEDKRFILTNGSVNNQLMRFHVKRTRNSPALAFRMGQGVTIEYGGRSYEVVTNTFAPRTLVGSVVCASGEITFFHHSDVVNIISNT